MSAIAANATVEIRSATLGDTAAIREILAATATTDRSSSPTSSDRTCATSSDEAGPA
jgi:hypothetical protein